MNERIRELIGQAKFMAEETINKQIPKNAELDAFAEKFAELIVRECADKVSQMVMMDKGYIPKDPHSVGWNSAVAYASEELKRYYGIEE